MEAPVRPPRMELVVAFGLQCTNHGCIAEVKAKVISPWGVIFAQRTDASDFGFRTLVRRLRHEMTGTQGIFGKSLPWRLYRAT